MSKYLMVFGSLPKIVLAFPLGIVVGYLSLLYVPDYAVYTLMLCCGLCALFFRWQTVFVLLGGLFFQISVEQHLSKRWPERLDKSVQTAIVKLVNLPKTGETRASSRYNLQLVRPIVTNDFVLPAGCKLRISDYQHLAIKPNENWSLQLTLRTPRSSANPAGFDYEKWLFSERFCATGYLKNTDNNYKRKDVERVSLLSLRFRLSRYLERHGSLNPLLKALLMADKRALEDSHHQQLQRLGLSHLFVISGLHIGMIAAAAWCLAAGLKRLLWWPLFAARGIYLQAAFAFFSAVAYAGLAGFSLPTLRALIMLAVALLAQVSFRHYKAQYSLLLAACWILLLDPFAVMSVSFWLSFMATASLLWVLRSTHKVRDFCVAQLAIFMVMLVIGGLFGLPIALFGPLINLVAIPLMTFCLLPLSFLSLLSDVLFGWHLPLALVSELFDTLWHGIRLLDTAAIPVLQLQPLLLQSILAIAGLMVISFYRRFSWFGGILVLQLLVPVKMISNDVIVTVLDVGQGLAIIIKGPDESVLYDTGARYPSGFSFAEAVVEPSLKFYGIEQLSALIISHHDNDHAGGEPWIRSRFTIQNSYGPEVPNRPNHHRCDRQQLVYKEFSIRFITPELSRIHDKNNRSCVAILEAYGVMMLLPGDIEILAELALIREPDIKGVEYLVVPHHGSKTSSSSAFLDAMSLQAAIVSAGFNNHFGHPHQVVTEQYQSRAVELLNTAKAGAIELSIKPNGNVAIRKYRHQPKRFWRP